jgi:hypothetical protein
MSNIVSPVTRAVSGAIVCLLAVCSCQAFAAALSPDARLALSKLLPPGYRTAAVLPCSLEADRKGRFVAALTDDDPDQPEKPVRLLYLAWNRGWTVLDSVEIAGTESLTPQYLNGISVVPVGQGSLLYVYTNWSAGGSGSRHYNQFFTAVSGRLVLLKTFEHERMQRGYLCLSGHRIYDAKLVKRRGQKKGNAYIYACFLDVTEFTYDGQRILAVRSERVEERTGNRFLDESYWNISLRSILRRGGHFLPVK